MEAKGPPLILPRKKKSDIKKKDPFWKISFIVALMFGSVWELSLIQAVIEVSGSLKGVLLNTFLISLVFLFFILHEILWQYDHNKNRIWPKSLKDRIRERRDRKIA
jgi:hypothetical protein